MCLRHLKICVVGFNIQVLKFKFNNYLFETTASCSFFRVCDVTVNCHRVCRWPLMTWILSVGITSWLSHNLSLLHWEEINEATTRRVMLTTVMTMISLGAVCWEGWYSLSCSRNSPSLWKNLRIHYRVLEARHWSLLRQTNPVHILIHHVIILLQKVPLFHVYSNSIMKLAFFCLPCIPHILPMSSYMIWLSWLYLERSTSYEIPHCASLPSFVSFWSRCSPYRLILDDSESVILPWSGTAKHRTKRVKVRWWSV
jgi:hypothetical protein